jgi:serine/threonine protein phosphatase PrpC
MEIKFYGITDVGNKRKNNEDALWPPPGIDQHPFRDHARGQLYVVADGMGGYGAGEVASHIAITTISTLYYDPTTPGDNPHNWLQVAIEVAHQNIGVESHTSEGKTRMGTTVVAVVILDDELWVGWAGDSRAYLLRDRHLEQLTEDHAVLWEQVKRGDIKWDALHYHPFRSRLNNSLTAQRPQAAPDFAGPLPLRPGDQVMLCSDGLSSEIQDAEIRPIMLGNSMFEAAQVLIAAAKRPKIWLREGEPVPSQGGEDNVTVIIIHTPGVIPETTAATVKSAPISVSPPTVETQPIAAPAPAASTGGGMGKWLGMAAVLLLLLLVVVAAALYLLLNNPSLLPPAMSVGPVAATQPPADDASIELGLAQDTPTSPAPEQTRALEQGDSLAEALPDQPATDTPEPTSTLANIDTPTPVPPTSTPTFTPIPPSPTPTPTVITATVAADGVAARAINTALWPTPELLQPKPLSEAPVTYITNIPQNFRWRWEGGLLPKGYGFEIRIGLGGEPLVGAYDARELTSDMFVNGNVYSFVFTLDSAAAVTQSSDQYFWQVGVVQLEPYEWLDIASEPRRINIAFPGPGGGPAPGDE